MRHVSVLIPCAGSGKRMGTAIPKQFLEIDGKPILFYTLKKFEACQAVHEIVLIISPHFEARLKSWIQAWRLSKISALVHGGKERQDSVFKGLKALSPETDIVLIHDAVRPFVSLSKIEELIQATIDTGAAILAVSTINTVKEVKDRVVKQTVDRNLLWQVQTPQGFHKYLILAAYEKARKNSELVTDDAMLVEALGHDVYIIQGQDRNFKIRSPEDFEYASFLIKSGKI